MKKADFKKYFFGSLGLLTQLTDNRSSKVLYYHDVHRLTQYTDMSTSIILFNKHIELIQKHYSIVDIITEPKRQIQLCFDDGFKGIYDNRKYFYEKGLCPTIFLATVLIGKDGYLNEKEIRELKGKGFRFQSHAHSHKNLTSFNEKALTFELEHSKSKLEELLNQSVEELCFPIGYFSERVLLACKKAGYKKLYSSIPGSYYSGRDKGIIYRNLVQFSSPYEFKGILNGSMGILSSWYHYLHFVKDS